MTPTRRFAALLVSIVSFAPSFVRAAAPLHRLDSQIVLERYELEMTDLAQPKSMIFTYNISQAGPTNIEQQHRLYRSGIQVRDETISVDGQPLKDKVVRIERREDRYAIERVAPRPAEYELVFLHAIKRGGHYDYEYEATPLGPWLGGFAVTRMIVDGLRDLPRTIYFRTSAANARGEGEIDYGPASGHWVPLAATVDATVRGKPARERIVWSDYSFPKELPPSTFHTARPLPRITHPPF
jgi:hypothetical protein